MNPALQPNNETFLSFLFFSFFYGGGGPHDDNKKEIHKQLSQILWLRAKAKVEPINASNLTPICIVADVITIFIQVSVSTPSGTETPFSTLHLSN